MNNYTKIKKTEYSISYLNGKNQFHRIDGPAYIDYDENGNLLYEAYYINGIPFRENNLPNHIHYYEYDNIAMEVWWNERTQKHNEHGPARIFYKEIDNE